MRHRPKQRAGLNPVRLGVEELEDRLAPANFITIATGGSASIPAGATTFTDTGNYTIAPSAVNSAAGSVTLEANDDIAFNNSFGVNGGFCFTARAGRSITVAANVIFGSAGESDPDC
jgi:hypothetical protein